MARKTALKEKPPEERRVRPDQEELRVAAYYRWMSRGCPAGDDLSDWVAVEKERTEALGGKWEI